MTKKTYNDIPNGYSVCEHNTCPLADSCLHQIAYRQLKETDEFLRLINPCRCSQSNDCQYYRNSAPITYARGFTNFQKLMFPQQYKEFMALCINHWSRNPYFERRRGDYPLPPSEQDFILQALKKCGVTDSLQFDRYEELINWYD
ncbi:MAG: hypothetical protein KBT34_07750 [Prevotella sp.]|nr:hypothetical protein [Candidatus Prevotella equi]